ncbi:MAG: hypothetical protein DDT21_02460 [Syntrophomonadaceae bacterium]|nr:hypothetical protein [Bacillota bacterium]
MPKRSNPFQKLVAVIENQLAGNGVKVLESIELDEYKGSTKREIDVLIEADVNGLLVRIAIECRNHKRQQDKTWIDQLIGKYRDLKVDKVVAVSRSGFTSGALEKAAEVNIETLTFENALDQNWPSYFTKVYARFLVQRISSMSAHLEYDEGGNFPNSTGDALKSSRIESRDGTLEGTLEQVVMSLFNNDAKIAIQEKVDENVLELLTNDDIVHFRQINVPYKVTDRFLVDHDGIRYKIDQITLQFELHFQNVPASDEKRYIYKRNQVMVSTLSSNDLSHPVSVVMVQTPEQAILLRPLIEFEIYPLVGIK